MKRVIVGVFAHPDDEAFGPSGYLHLAALEGSDVHLILVTDGGSGTNQGYDDLVKTRLAEWQKAGRLIGVASQVSFGYRDGSLSNNDYEDLCGRIKKRVEAVLDEYREPVICEFLTFDPNGLTGHLDHIAVSLITTCCYERLRRDGAPGGVTIGHLRYFCLPISFVSVPRTEWLLMPAGYPPESIDEVVDIAAVLPRKREIMWCHQSQRNDVETAIAMQEAAGPDGAREHFRYYLAS